MTNRNEFPIVVGTDDRNVRETTAYETSEQGAVSPWWYSKRALVFGSLALLTAAAVVTALLLTQRTPEAQDPVAVTVPVALSGTHAPEHLKLGVVVTLGQGQSEGSEWSLAAEGAAVARYRLAAGGTDVELVVEDDHGTDEGSAAAVTTMVEQGVSGIVFATSGTHLTTGLERAAQAKLPVVLPYAALPDGVGPMDAWSFAPNEENLESVLNDAITGFEYPLLLDAGPGIPRGVETRETLRPVSNDMIAFAAEAALRTGADNTSHGVYAGTPDDGATTPELDSRPRADVLVLSGHPRMLALLVTQLQKRNVTVPLVLAPAATSPGFAQALGSQEGSVSTVLESVGIDLGDAVALGHDGQARSLSAYLQALRQLSDDPEAINLLGDAPFVESAEWADVRSHDAVLALVTAAGEARSIGPGEVAREMHELQLVAGDGIAGTALDFSRPAAADGKVQVLHATGQAFGLRPTTDSPLSWFAAPSTTP